MFIDIVSKYITHDVTHVPNVTRTQQKQNVFSGCDDVTKTVVYIGVVVCFHTVCKSVALHGSNP